MWQELDALRGLKTYSFKEFVQVEDPSGKVFTVYTNLNELKKHMEELATQDKKLIGEYIKQVNRFSDCDLFSALSGGIGTELNMIPLLGAQIKYIKITLKDYAEKFSIPFYAKHLQQYNMIFQRFQWYFL